MRRGPRCRTYRPHSERCRITRGHDAGSQCWADPVIPHGSCPLIPCFASPATHHRRRTALSVIPRPWLASLERRAQGRSRGLTTERETKRGHPSRTPARPHTSITPSAIDRSLSPSALEPPQLQPWNCLRTCPDAAVRSWAAQTTLTAATPRRTGADWGGRAARRSWRHMVAGVWPIAAPRALLAYPVLT